MAIININNNERILNVEDGQALLVALGENRIFIPSICGGNGICGTCRIKVIEGAGPITPAEIPHLSERERSVGLRLACQVTVRDKLKIEIPRELLQLDKFSSFLSSKIPLTHDIVKLRLKITHPAGINFRAGQYILLDIPAYENYPAVSRAFSIASAPSDPTHIDLIVKRVPKGIGTGWIFNYLKAGDKLTFSGPFGNFGLSETTSPIIFIAGGSGMSPILSILYDMSQKGISNRTAHFFYGALTQKDLFFIKRLEEFQNLHPWFTFIPSLSNEPENSSWTGERGLVTEVVQRHFSDCGDYEAYLCGSPGMIEACLKVLAQLKVKDVNIYYDKFA